MNKVSSTTEHERTAVGGVVVVVVVVGTTVFGSRYPSHPSHLTQAPHYLSHIIISPHHSDIINNINNTYVKDHCYIIHL